MAKKPSEDWGFDDYLQEWDFLKKEQAEWRTEARKISAYILPGRGIYNDLNRVNKRKLTAPNVVNPIAKDALRVLTSGMQGGLTSPSRPWFKLAFSRPELQTHPVLSRWLYDAEKRLYSALSKSNFYQSIHSFYTEYAGFGTAALYVGEDGAPFRFELLTFGEYCIGINTKGLVDRFYRIIFMTGQMLLDEYESELPESMLDKREDLGFLHQWYSCLEATVPRKFMGKAFTKVLYLVGTADSASKPKSDKKESGVLLSKTGFYEFPYPTARWDIVGSDVYGIGPGSEMLADVMRLQEMEMSASMAVHKSVSPPLFVPAHLKNKVKSLPNGITYSRNTMNEKVTTLYDVRFDYKGVLEFIDRVVGRIQKACFNDIFLTASRDPNASPLKAAQVNRIEDEGVLRLGPVIERLHYEFLQPLLERCFNILLRDKQFMALAPQDQALLDGADFDIVLVSALAQAQKAMGIQPIQSFLQFVAAASQFAEESRDLVDIDTSIREYGDITGAPSIIIRSPEDVQAIRQQRAQAQQAAQQAAQQQVMSAAQQQSMQARAQTAKTLSEAGVNMSSVLGPEGTANGVQ